MQPNSRWTIAPTVFAITIFAAQQATAAATALPWETPLQTIQASLTGPVAVAISIIAIMIAGGVLLFGGEINEFARRLIMVVLVVALVVGAVSIFSTLFGVTGASIGSEAQNGNLIASLIVVALLGAVGSLIRRFANTQSTRLDVADH